MADDCKIWPGACNEKRGGYGAVKINGKTRRVHVVEYEKHYGPLPKGMIVMHTCDNPPCYNIAHLKAGTHRDNVADKVAKGRQSRRYTGARPRVTRSHVLSVQQKAEIKTLYEDGFSQREIARAYGVSQSAVSWVVSSTSPSRLQRTQRAQTRGPLRG